MRQIFHITLAVLASVALFAACSKVEPVDETPAVKVMTIKATISDAATRVTFDPVYGSDSKPTSMGHTWQAGDKLRITDASDATKTALFDLVDGAGSATGTFEGNGFEAASYNVEAVPQGSFSSGFTQTQAKDGATDHLQFVATATGVTDLSSFTLAETSGIVGVIAKLPEDVAGTITALEIEAKVAGLPMSIKVTVNLTAQEDVDSDDILKVYANAPTGFAIPAGAEVFLRFKSNNPDHTVYTRYQKFDSNLLPVPGKFNYVKFNCKDIDKFAGAGNDGSSTDPYQIADKYQMLAMQNLLKEEETICFSLLADIDLENEDWTPLNTSGSFAKGLFFEGNGHTVKNFKSTSSNPYPSFAGVLNGTVKDVTFDGATIDAGNNTAGVLAGYIGSGTAIFGNISGITVKNSTVSGTKQRLGGIAGYVKNVSETIDDCHVINTTVESAADRVGGLFGQFDKSFMASNCTAENVSVHGSINIGGLVGVGYGNFTDCTSSGTVSSTNTTSNADIALGGLVGYFENGVISHCSSSVSIDQTTNGRDIGGLIGKMLAGTVEKSFATGDIQGMQRNVGGFIGLISNSSGTSTVTNCYSTGSVTGNAHSGGFIGYFEKGKAVISDCYATGSVSGSFSMGGLIGYVANNGLSMSKSAAWNGSVTAASIAVDNWSSGAVVGVTFPNCTLKDNYRNPSMALTVWWVPDADYNQPNVSTGTPLVVKDITDGTLRQLSSAGLSSTQDNYPQFAYHGKVEAGKTLSQLASTTLGWDSDVWDFSGDVPTLK
jgi:The GLUG motif.